MTTSPAPTGQEIDAWLAHVRQWRGTPPDDGPPTILLGGPMRCGKSTVAGLLAARTGMVVLPTDVINRRFGRGKLPPGRERAVLGRVLRHVLHSHPRGLILEGVMLFERTALVLPTARRLALPIHAIGYASGTVTQKLAHIEAHRVTGACWTLEAGLDQEALRLSAHVIRAESRVLRAMARLRGYQYHELDSACFEIEAKRVADRITAALSGAELDQARPL